MPQNKAVYPGSFNPIHDGHREIIKVSQLHYGFEVTLEISKKNIDKADISYVEADARVSEAMNNSTADDAVVTYASLFLDKFLLFKNVTFIIGMDTCIRLFDPKYPRDYDSFKNLLQKNKLNFLVFDRKDFEAPSIPEELFPRFKFVPKTLYTDSGISSSQIREG